MNVYQKMFVSKLGWGYKMSMVGQSRSLGIIFCMPKIKEPMVERSTFLFFHWNRKSKLDDPMIISSLAFTPETKMSYLTYFTSPYSFCPNLHQMKTN